MTEDLTIEALPLLPLENGVVVPTMVVNVAIDSSEAHAAVDASSETDRRVVLVPRQDGEYARIGAIAQIEQLEPLPDGRRAALIRGVERVRIGAGTAEQGGLHVHVHPVEEPSGDPERVEQLVTEFRAVASGLLERRGGRQLAAMLSEISEPGQLADLAVYAPELTFAQKIEILETLDVAERLERALGWLRDRLAEASVQADIESQVTEELEETQREQLLRRQLEAIKRELGEGDAEDPAARYRERLEELETRGDGVPTAVRDAVERELGRLERTSEQNPEHGWIRSYLDALTELPWGVRDRDTTDLDAAREVLDADHAGLEKIKDRVVEQLAVRKLRVDRGLEATGEGSARRGEGAILTLIGPPGVGKTSLGESVARALGRQFVRIALGGVRDEAEIRGHRRTYVGAQPGRIARALEEAGTMNPVVVLDEIDKVGADWRGDPSSALLEVLDPAQNHTFRDHYLELDLDLSDVIFLATGNVADTIPPALGDRMEVLRLDGYSDTDKHAIARDHLLPAQLAAHGLEPHELTVDDGALDRIISEYTREAGVRALQRGLATVARKVATRIASDTTEPPVAIGLDDVPELLGPRTFQRETAVEIDEPGVATGLAVTGAGGEILFVEAAALPDGESGLQITGQLGDVMRESAQIALAHVRSHAGGLGLGDAVTDRPYHVHVPAGATPKDGPSAGVAMTATLASLVSGRRVRGDVGMTGEITLQGKVLPVGGITAKVLAAHRAGLAEVILPGRNAPDLDEVPDEVREAVQIHLVDRIEDALAIALEAPEALAA
ncbi:endopeptidase La [Egibacter rhizosphaerae]|uniref:Lon protease n=1 Tax=Egibacter rhizosphaerae TaxID=1670831 RepID=A0A411YBW4_9ACTN|nr:endopeptidase La [Egibacter rhizosphaerae]QBI18694.1 endopeptidase La [Egibacter rhizosphaerae]